MDTRTPGPWTLADDYSDVKIRGAKRETVIGLGDNGACGDPECCGAPSYHVELSEADAKFIVLAENSHEKLVAALEAAPIFSKYHGQSGFDMNKFAADFEDWHVKRRAALASIKEQPL
jgi:hypothetical protein